MLPEGDLRAARTVSPRHYLESLGYAVTGNDERGHLAVDKVLRVDRKPDGHWVACEWHGGPIGDNPAMVCYFEPHKRFPEAVQTLMGTAPVAVPRPLPAQKPSDTRPRLPPASAEHIRQGRVWLHQRGISSTTIAAAENVGMLRYGPNGVFFLGRDQAGEIRSATKRMLAPEPAPGDPDKLITKRDFANSDKRHPAILPGHRASRTLHLVEGGTDALALHDIARRRNAPAPTVIVTGGAHVRLFLDNPRVQKRIQAAERVVVHAEQEKSPAIQVHTDTAHAKQADLIRKLRPAHGAATVTLWKPPLGKDLADYNQHLQAREKPLSSPPPELEPPRQAGPEREAALQRH